MAVAGTLYERLGVARDAAHADVRRAYRQASLRHHPDKGGSREDFQAIAEAYTILSDPEKRRAYDVTGDVALVELELDLDAMMAEVFDEGGWFEQMVSSAPEMAELMEEGATMAEMQGSFASFMRHSLGGGDGSVLMPDGSRVAAPRMGMPSLHELIEGAADEEERALFVRIGRKMGLGGRGALVAGTGMQALQALEQLASQPGFWSDDDEGEEGGEGEGEGEDAYLDELRMQLSLRASSKEPSGGAPATSARRRRRGGGDGALTACEGTGAGAGAGAPLVAPPRPAAALPPCLLPPCLLPPCLASPQLGKRWLDAAREGDQAEPNP